MATTPTVERPDYRAHAAATPAAPATMVVRVEQVTKQYSLDGQRVTALSGVSVNIEEGVFLAIAGPSGSGKSTLLNLIGCIDTPTSGGVWIDGEDVAKRTPDQLAGLRARAIGFVFQSFNLFPVLTAAENVEYPLLKRSEIGASERAERVRKYLDLVGLKKFAEHRPNQLSGGQRQRVAIARALVTHPRIVLADEPTANLDHKTGKRILRLMKKINRATGTTFVFSTHDQKVLNMADRRVDLEDGEIVRLGMRVADKWVFALERGPDALMADEDVPGPPSVPAG
jgi:putative ABC transport system ATP-binding protein